jgi:hypothetical protein
MTSKNHNMNTIVLCIYGNGENCGAESCPMFKKCW